VRRKSWNFEFLFLKKHTCDEEGHAKFKVTKCFWRDSLKFGSLAEPMSQKKKEVFGHIFFPGGCNWIHSWEIKKKTRKISDWWLFSSGGKNWFFCGQWQFLTKCGRFLSCVGKLSLRNKNSNLFIREKSVPRKITSKIFVLIFHKSLFRSVFYISSTNLNDYQNQLRSRFLNP